MIRSDEEEVEKLLFFVLCESEHSLHRLADCLSCAAFCILHSKQMFTSLPSDKRTMNCRVANTCTPLKMKGLIETQKNIEGKNHKKIRPTHDLAHVKRYVIFSVKKQV